MHIQRDFNDFVSTCNQSWGSYFMKVIYYILHITFISVSRHTVVCRAAQGAGTPHPWVYWQEERKRHFHTFVSQWSLIWLEPNLLHSCPPARGVYIPNLKEIAPAISEIRAAKVSFFFLRFFSSSSSFRTLAKIAITSKRVLRSPWNLAHRKGVQRRILSSNLVQIRWMVQELWPIIRVKQDQFVVTPTG